MLQLVFVFDLPDVCASRDDFIRDKRSFDISMYIARAHMQRGTHSGDPLTATTSRAFKDLTTIKSRKAAFQNRVVHSL
jgi:hypothetical protein